MLQKKQKFAGKISCILLLLITCGETAKAQQSAEKVNIGLVYPVSTNGTGAPNNVNKFSFNLLGGVSSGERGLSIAGLFNIVGQYASGLQLAGFSNHVHGRSDGILIGGFMNTAVKGSGLSLAGFTNIAAHSSGSQVAGFMNIGGNVSGFQLSGFVNIADSANCQIGFINISKNGEKSLGVTIDETRTTMLTFRSGGRVVYGVVGLGYNFKNKQQKYAWEAGLGLHTVYTDIFRLNAELTESSLESFKGGDYHKTAVKLLPVLRLWHIELFGGPTYNFVRTSTAEGRELHNHYSSTGGGENGHDFHGFYWGYTAGIQVGL